MFLKRSKEKGINYYPIKYVTNGLIYQYGDIIYYVNNDYGYTFFSQRAQDSWGLPVNHLDRLEDSMPTKIVGVLGFRGGTLIQNAKDGRIYLISGSIRRLLTAPLGDYGFDISQVIEVSDAEIEFHTEGENI